MPLRAWFAAAPLAPLAGAGEAPGVTVTVPAGSTLDVAIDSLAAHGVVDHAALFRVYARLRGLRGSPKSGVYLLRGHSAWSDVADTLERGPCVELPSTPPPHPPLPLFPHLPACDPP